MTAESHRHTLTWLALMALTLVSYNASTHAATAIILSAAGIKAITLAWNFMDLRHAHLLWKAAIFTLLLVVLVAAGALHSSVYSSAALAR